MNSNISKIPSNEEASKLERDIDFYGILVDRLSEILQEKNNYGDSYDYKNHAKQLYKTFLRLLWGIFKNHKEIPQKDLSLNNFQSLFIEVSNITNILRFYEEKLPIVFAPKSNRFLFLHRQHKFGKTDKKNLETCKLAPGDINWQINHIHECITEYGVNKYLCQFTGFKKPAYIMSPMVSKEAKAKIRPKGSECSEPRPYKGIPSYAFVENDETINSNDINNENSSIESDFSTSEFDIDSKDFQRFEQIKIWAKNQTGHFF